MPLSTWICDSCGDPISRVAVGVLTWRDGPGGGSDFMIVHKGPGGCDPGAAAGFSPSLDLYSLTGPEGLTRLLALLSAGPLKGPKDYMPEVKDFDQFVDLVRRLHVPWYEEARERFDEPAVQHEFSDANEVLPYLPESLEQIAKHNI